MRKRTVTCLAVLFLALAAYPAVCGASKSKKTFTIVAIPDTQVYSEESALTPIFKAQIDWILANRKNENIVFVTHLGDVVDNAGDPEQWNNAMWALDPLFDAPADFPYSICQGNHDGTEFAEYLGPESYAGKKWYIGSSPNKLNHAQVFRGGNRTFLHINFQKDPDAEAFSWAQTIMDKRKYSSMPVIVSTHDYVMYGGRGPTGRIIWDEFIRANPRIFMVLNGHTHTEYAFVSHNDANKPVYQMLSDYQDRDNGGNGLMRLIRISEDTGTISVETFSPGFTIDDDGDIITVDTYFETDDDSQFAFTTNLKQRFKHRSRYDFGDEPERPPLPPAEPITEPATHIFQERLNGYEGTIDSQINENNPGLDYGGEMTLTTDLDDSGSRVNGLLAFTGIIGNGPGQIPAGSTITSAKILFEATSSTAGTISFHRMLMPFTEKSTWYDFTPQPVTWHDVTFYDPKNKEFVTQTVMVGGGVEANNIEALSESDTAFSCPKGFPTPFIVDVTKSIQAWADGETNYGWAMLNNSTDGWDFLTSHAGNAPALVVIVEGAPLL